MELTQEYIRELFDYKEGFLFWRINKGRVKKAILYADHILKKEINIIELKLIKCIIKFIVLFISGTIMIFLY